MFLSYVQCFEYRNYNYYINRTITEITNFKKCVTMSMVNTLVLLIAFQQPSVVFEQQPPPAVQVGFHITIFGVHFDDRIRLEKANCSWMHVDRCACIHVDHLS